MLVSNIAEKRSILFSSRIRFSPKTQPVIETAIDKIIEQTLLVNEKEEGLAISEIEKQETICFKGSEPKIHFLDIQRALIRLIDKKRIEVSGIRGQERYKLSKNAEAELLIVQKAAEQKFSKVVKKLFRNAKKGYFDYHAPFIEGLCRIFSKLGENYVRLMKGDVTVNELLGLPIIINTLKDIKKNGSSGFLVGTDFNILCNVTRIRKRYF